MEVGLRDKVIDGNLCGRVDYEYKKSWRKLDVMVDINQWLPMGPRISNTAIQAEWYGLLSTHHHHYHRLLLAQLYVCDSTWILVVLV